MSHRDRLDELGRQVRDHRSAEPPNRQWLDARLARRRQHRRLGALSVALIALGGGLALAANAPADTERTEILATDPDPDAGPTADPLEDRDRDAEGDAGPPGEASATSASTGSTVPEPAEVVPGCGPWPVGLVLWPGQDPAPPVDTVDDEGRLVRRQSLGDTTLEVTWPPTPRTDYDLDVGTDTGADGVDPLLDAGDYRPWYFQRDGISQFGFAPNEVADDDPDGQVFDPNEPPGMEFLRIANDPATMASIEPLDGPCADFEFQIFVDGESAYHAGFGFESFNEFEEVTYADGETFRFRSGPEWLELGPIVVERRDVATVPGSIRCAGPDDLGIGPTSGPGTSGSHPEPIDALKAFFEHPAADTFITSGLVELLVDPETVAYGVPQGHGQDGWITVITTERQAADGSWQVTGWTSAGC